MTESSQSNEVIFENLCLALAVTIINSQTEKKRKVYNEVTKPIFNEEEDSSPIRILCKDYCKFLRTNVKRKGKINQFRILKFREYQQHILKKTGIPLKVGLDSFRTDYKRLFMYEDLHYYASQDIVRHRHIRKWLLLQKGITFLGEKPKSVQDLDDLLTRASTLFASL